MSLTDKQKAARAQALGSSDAPVVCGVSPYKGPLELYYQLHGELPRYDDQETEAQEWGHRLEAVIGQAYADKTGERIRRARSAKSHPRYPFMVAHLDFEILRGAGSVGILECKARDRSELREWESHGVPDAVRLQVYHQLSAARREWACVAVLFGGKQFRTFEIERDKELEEYLIEIEARFMLRVQQGEPPDETWTPDTLHMLRKLYPQDSGQVITLSEAAVSAVVGYLGARQNEEEAYALKAQYEGWLKGKIGDASVAKIPGFGEITWKSTKPGKDFDEARFKVEHPDLYKQYETARPGHRRFMVKPSKEVSCPTKKLPSDLRPSPLPPTEPLSPSLPET